VAKLSLQLYDGLLHSGHLNSPQDPDERLVLQIATLVHDVGRHRGEKKSHKITLKLVRGLAPPLGINEETLKISGVVARYHSGALPRAGQKTLLGLIQSQRQLVNRLASILRLAEAFDADHSGRIQKLVVQEHKGFVLVIAEGYAARDPLAEKIAAARHLLETVLRSPVLVKPLLVKRTKRARGENKPVLVAKKPKLETLTLLPS
jgi:exopolyphosphatase/guanosine-5'-triphosphate,3'-diphosphate pyrophosphatase